MTQSEREKVKSEAAALIKKSGIYLNRQEEENLEITDFGLGDFYSQGLVLHTYVNTERACAKELAMFPGQTCVEHRHPPLGAGNPGKEETFRCRYGEMYLYVAGEATAGIKAKLPETKNGYTAFCEVVLRQGDQYTLAPDTLHWFQAGPQGAVVSEFSSHSDDGSDIFTDPAVVRSGSPTAG
ncbi:MAG: D-lyxose/D-mannose family sugar isomerase [Spirochaetes bacterium]|nr:D-lyxose/D-mannose family sugar isomerase [Spirochaetota bacterium]